MLNTLSEAPAAADPLATLQPIVRLSVNEAVYQALRNKLMHGEYQAGQVLGIQSLADALGTSTMPVREALRRLVAQQGLEPRRLYRARLSYEERHRAREAGFRWNEPVSGAWSRRLSEREAALLPFPVVPVDGDQQRRSA